MTKETKKTKEEAFDLTKFPSKSAAIRHLSAQGMTRSEIVKVITVAQGRPIRYQHVRNVLITPLIREVK